MFRVTVRIFQSLRTDMFTVSSPGKIAKEASPVVTMGSTDDKDVRMMNNLTDDLVQKTARDKKWVAHDPSLSTILAPLLNLTSLGIYTLCWRNPSRIHQCILSFEHTITPQITSPYLDYVHFGTLPGLLGILVMLRGLKRLPFGVIMAPPYLAVLLRQMMVRGARHGEKRKSSRAADGESVGNGVWKVEEAEGEEVLQGTDEAGQVAGKSVERVAGGVGVRRMEHRRSRI
ncbi:uncharacterized protein BT62DRAFT_1012892 [Guyanagaster necrorhizus]|uniref:Uncharacterized protein n=1 Tax=Guyanagaster necrorhizus TaxID=856835 RepID=A0A9P8ALW6_9AGAR|nr:uncharacterized protein BT62DRAFT_1012892 [Guyanagaster necrorhizus MCA 3950]KAG7440240.1 hypothetical protein BT62DRAFT_1012892 [Guyanagaster necrorhizus MCA 3950]